MGREAKRAGSDKSKAVVDNAVEFLGRLRRATVDIAGDDGEFLRLAAIEPLPTR
jgi:hypothetical protein